MIRAKNEKADVLSFTVSGQEMIGAKRRVIIEIWQSDDGPRNSVVKVMQIPTAGVSGPKKPSRAAPERLVEAPAMPPRPSTTEPLHDAALPY